MFAALVEEGRDRPVLELNRQAKALMPARCRIAVVPAATHTFDEPGTLEQVADLACQWFTAHLVTTRNLAS